MDQPTGYEFEVIGDLKEDFECPICLFLLREAVELPCLHVFCKLCLENWQNNQIEKNPNFLCLRCKKIYQKEQVNGNKYVDKLVRTSLQVKCKNSKFGCPWKGTILDYTDHEKKCLHKSINCDFDGCNERVLKSELDKHQTGCPYRSEHCEYCMSFVQFIHLKTHYESCKEFPVSCSNHGCSELKPRKEIDDHRQKECLFEIINCRFGSIGCKHTLQRQQINKHENEAMVEHINILLNGFNANSQELCSMKEKLHKNEENVENISEKLQHTEKQFQKTNVKLEQTEKQLQKTNVKLEQTEKQLQKTNVKLQKTVGDLQEANKKLDTANKNLKESNGTINENVKIADKKNLEIIHTIEETNQIVEKIKMCCLQLIKTCIYSKHVQGNIGELLKDLSNDKHHMLCEDIPNTAKEFDEKFHRSFQDPDHWPWFYQTLERATNIKHSDKFQRVLIKMSDSIDYRVNDDEGYFRIEIDEKDIEKINRISCRINRDLSRGVHFKATTKVIATLNNGDLNVMLCLSPGYIQGFPRGYETRTRIRQIFYVQSPRENKLIELSKNISLKELVWNNQILIKYSEKTEVRPLIHSSRRAKFNISTLNT